MTDAWIENYERMLLEMAEHDLALAKTVFRRAMQTGDAQAMDDLSRTLVKLAQSARENLALRAELQRDRRRDARRDPPAQAAARAQDFAEALRARRRGPLH